MHTRQSVGEPASVKHIADAYRDIQSPQTPDRPMYPAAYTVEGYLLHSVECRSVFTRLDWNCPRCCELMMERAPKTGWERRFFAGKVRDFVRQIARAS